MADLKDINEEYEKIFGVEQRETPFNADDEEYKTFRQEILDAPRIYNTKRTLPFNGVKLLPYEDFKRSEIVREAEKQGYRIFYIKKYVGSELSTYAAGYFNIKDSKFYVLKGSFFKKTPYFTSLANSLTIFAKNKFVANYTENKGFLTQKDLYFFNSASLAASCILGAKSTFREWIDDRGKTLDAYYPNYKASDIDESENKAFPNYDASVSPTPRLSSPSSPFVNKLTEVERSSTSTSSRHLFAIKQEDKYDVKGYYDDSEDRFTILKGGWFAAYVDEDFDETSLGASRRRFIETACIQKDNKFEVAKNTKCKTASLAASYVIGERATYTLWRDSNGKYLKDYFPSRFVVGGDARYSQASPVESTSEVHAFYIKKDNKPERYCDASGYYDPSTRKFIIKSGSVLSLEMQANYMMSPAGMTRRIFVNKYCSKRRKGYVLKRDVLMDSPSAAASCVIGRVANGWTEWKDAHNLTLDLIYRSRT